MKISIDIKIERKIVKVKKLFVCVRGHEEFANLEINRDPSKKILRKISRVDQIINKGMLDLDFTNILWVASPFPGRFVSRT